MFLCFYFEIVLSFDIEGQTPDSTIDYLDKTKKIWRPTLVLRSKMIRLF